MNNLKLVFLTLWGCFVLNFASAQSPAAKISGKVLDNSNKPVDGATIILMTVKDSVTVKIALANPDGSFSFGSLRDDAYQIRVTAIGYKNYSSEAFSISQQQSLDLPAIVLSPTSTALKEVSVTAQRSYIEQRIDRVVVNVGALISNTGSNALEVLAKAPGVEVDADGNISFKGKSGVMVMIDDKPTYLSAANLAAYLRSLPSSTIDQIELMENPPAKYDAAGTAGLINIKTKKNTIKGFNAVLSAGYGDGHYGRTSESLNLNYRVDKINLFVNASYSDYRTFRRLETDRDYFNADGSFNSSFKDISYFRPAYQSGDLKMGMDYYASPNTTWGIVFTGGLSATNDNSPVSSSFYNQSGGLDSAIRTQNSSKNKFDNGGVNLNYSHQFDKSGKALNFDLDYIRDVSGSNQTFLNNTFLPDGDLTGSQTITDNLPSYINIYAAKADFILPMGKAKLETGVKTSYVNTDNAANYFNVVNGISTVDNVNTNRFLYKENINAAYVNFSGTFSRFSLQTGLRLENTNGNGHQFGNAILSDSSFARHYTDLFPTAYFSYKLDTAGHQMLILSYGRRIGRPNYADLNPFTFLLDKFTYFSGNPFLKPQFTDNYSLSYNYQSLFTIALSYNYTSDFQNETIHQQGPIFVSTTGNIGERKNLDLSVSSNLQPAKWWSVNLSVEVYNNTFLGSLYSGYLDQSANSLSLSGNNEFTLGKGWSAELSGFFDSRRINAQFISSPSGMLNAGLQKKVMKNRGTIRLNLGDILHTYTSDGMITNIPNAKVSYQNYFDTQAATVGFTYNFGKTVDNPPKRDIGSADSEQSRAHN
jgi:hypothetical protein